MSDTSVLKRADSPAALARASGLWEPPARCLGVRKVVLNSQLVRRAMEGQRGEGLVSVRG